MATEHLLALSTASFLLCCSGGAEPHAPAPSPSSPGLATGRPADAVARAAQPAANAPGEGLLELVAATDVTSYLGSLHAVVKDADGQVVGGADEDIAVPEAAHERSLSLVLPAGDEYTVSLTAATTDAQPTICRASVAGLRIAVGSTARARIFSWDCGGVSGYVPAAVDSDCHWLADWSFVTRTSAAIGDLIDVGAAGHDRNGDVPTFSWSTASPERGVFADAQASKTAFRCQAAAKNLPLTVALSAGGCQQQVTQIVSCL